MGSTQSVEDFVAAELIKRLQNDKVKDSFSENLNNYYTYNGLDENDHIVVPMETIAEKLQLVKNFKKVYTYQIKICDVKLTYSDTILTMLCKLRWYDLIEKIIDFDCNFGFKDSHYETALDILLNHGGYLVTNRCDRYYEKKLPKIKNIIFKLSNRRLYVNLHLRTRNFVILFMYPEFENCCLKIIDDFVTPNQFWYNILQMMCICEVSETIIRALIKKLGVFEIDLHEPFELSGFELNLKYNLSYTETFKIRFKHTDYCRSTHRFTLFEHSIKNGMNIGTFMYNERENHLNDIIQDTYGHAPYIGKIVSQYIM